ncbi:hypothetical protein B484DRAFT_85709 [Ochromonadaceae sp. CCMP2298]|nr:hypothetical protein B484DRAFT_85709 [Ochromonadaceae sp. CCMP2298]
MERAACRRRRGAEWPTSAQSISTIQDARSGSACPLAEVGWRRKAWMGVQPHRGLRRSFRPASTATSGPVDRPARAPPCRGWVDAYPAQGDPLQLGLVQGAWRRGLAVAGGFGGILLLYCCSTASILRTLTSGLLLRCRRGRGCWGRSTRQRQRRTQR